MFASRSGAFSSSVRPDSVSATLLVVRASNWTPMLRSSHATCLVTLLRAMPSRLAVEEKLRLRATSTKIAMHLSLSTAH